MATTVNLTAENMSAADAIWALIQTQTKSVQKNLAKRFAALDKKERERRKMKAYETTLTPEQKAWAHDVANSINRALKEVKMREQGKISDDAFIPIETLLAELDEECANA